MTAPTSYKALLKEPALKEDATSGQEDQLPTYNAWSADGDVTGELVFVNYGLPEDYDKLAEMGIDVKGKIVIAKYGQAGVALNQKLHRNMGPLVALFIATRWMMDIFREMFILKELIKMNMVCNVAV